MAASDDGLFDRELIEDLVRTPFGRAISAMPVRWFHATIEGVERVPREGGALFVGNHAYLGIDAIVLGMLLLRGTGRAVRFLGERNFWRIPGFRRVLDAAGAIPGEPEAATRLLREGQLVAVYPGGVDDSFKLSSERYELKWGKRAGFARVAMRAKVPILPVAGLGIDEMYTVAARERWLGRAMMKSARYDMPIAFGALGTLVPRRAPQRYLVLDPIDTRGLDPDRPDDLERVRARTHDTLDAVLALERSPRE